jgi:hypothetical protein
MGNLIIFSVISTMVLAGLVAVDRKGELDVVGTVDLSRYAGRWYEIARLPNRFEKKCADSVTATYTLRSDGKVDVVNRCRKANGEYTTAKGKAKIVDKKTNAKLKVTFFWPFLSLDPESYASTRRAPLSGLARKDGSPRLRNRANDPNLALTCCGDTELLTLSLRWLRASCWPKRATEDRMGSLS